MAKHNQAGQYGEELVAEYLKSIGYKIIEKNWKTKTCEIDIVAKKKTVVHFVEVKYRSKDDSGSGFDYITRAKLRQMVYSANMWVNINEYDGEYVLSAAQVDSLRNIDFIEEIQITDY